MPDRIRLLDETSIRQIAAGEVVERPSSIVKELLENSVDAGARRVALEIEEGGKKTILISDDGCGMTPGDAKLSLERHTTSKIRSALDLETLSTFGFRGEALPSIASVSKLELTTRSEEEPLGVSLSLSAGMLIHEKECGRERGTTVKVTDLFFNTPARLKFLKSDTTEKSKSVRVLEEIALAHPQISFRVRTDGRTPLELPARQDLIKRISELWGENFTKETMIPISSQHPYLKIEGWVSKPQAHQATKVHQIFYVNNRPILSRSISHALYESYRDCLPVGRHPAAVIFLILDPSQVDVNVHPSKREVRFRNEHQIYESLIREIRIKRSQLSSPPGIFSTPSNGRAQDVHLNFLKDTVQTPPEPPPFPKYTLKETPSQAYALRDAPHLPLEKSAFLQGATVLAQFNSLYIVAEQGENLVLIDQHAAAERILYEQFRVALHSGKPVSTQVLLIPFIWELSYPQTDLIREHLAILNKIGFIMEPFGEKTFRVQETPAMILETDLKESLDEILASLENSRQPALAPEEKIMHSACRAAIKANDRLSNAELANLIKELSLCSNPHTCPHGRPTVLTLTRGELDKKFGRT